MAENDEVVFQGKRFRVVRRSRPLAGDAAATREVVVHPGAVVILPWIDDERICLIENARVAVGETLLELPAGTLEPPEPPIETARRELSEETGFRCGKLQLLHEFYPSPGGMSERMYLYSATQLTPGPQQLEPGEEIRVVVTPWSEAVRMAGAGEIRDAKTLVGILLCEHWRRAGDWPPASVATRS